MSAAQKNLRLQAEICCFQLELARQLACRYVIYQTLGQLGKFKMGVQCSRCLGRMVTTGKHIHEPETLK